MINQRICNKWHLDLGAGGSVGVSCMCIYVYGSPVTFTELRSFAATNSIAPQSPTCWESAGPFRSSTFILACKIRAEFNATSWWFAAPASRFAIATVVKKPRFFNCPQLWQRVNWKSEQFRGRYVVILIVFVGTAAGSLLARCNQLCWFFLWGRVCVALFHWVYADVVRHSYNYRIHSAFALMGAWEVIPSTAHVYSLIDKPVL
jgi:hypothetical protein